MFSIPGAMINEEYFSATESTTSRTNSSSSRSDLESASASTAQKKSARVSRNIFSKLGAYLSTLFLRRRPVTAEIPRVGMEQKVKIRDGLILNVINGEPISLEISGKRTVDLKNYWRGQLCEAIHDFTLLDAEALYKERESMDRTDMTSEQSANADWFDAEDALVEKIIQPRRRLIEAFDSTEKPNMIYQMEGTPVSGNLKPVYIGGFTTETAAREALKGHPDRRLVKMRDTNMSNNQYWVLSQHLTMKDLFKAVVIAKWQNDIRDQSQSNHTDMTIRSYFETSNKPIWDHADDAIKKSGFKKRPGVLVGFCADYSKNIDDVMGSKKEDELFFALALNSPQWMTDPTKPDFPLPADFLSVKVQRP